jgi:hypothetical protein
MISIYSQTPIAEKRQLPYVCLCNHGESQTENEMIYSFIVDNLLKMPFLYNEDRILTCSEINPEWCEIFFKFFKCMLKETSYEFMYKISWQLDIKPRPKPPSPKPEE